MPKQVRHDGLLFYFCRFIRVILNLFQDLLIFCCYVTITKEVEMLKQVQHDSIILFSKTAYFNAVQ